MHVRSNGIVRIEMQTKPPKFVRVAFMLPALRGGGVERNTIALAREFKKRGVSVDFVLAKAEGELLGFLPSDITCYVLRTPRRLALVLSLPSMVRYFLKKRPDVFFQSGTELTLYLFLHCGLPKLWVSGR